MKLKPCPFCGGIAEEQLKNVPCYANKSTYKMWCQQNRDDLIKYSIEFIQQTLKESEDSNV